MNEILNTISQRYSCRNFVSGKLVSDEHLELILDAALISPSGVNRQPWRLIAIRDQALIDDLESATFDYIKNLEDKTMYDRIMSRGGKPVYNTPCVIWIAIDEKASKYATMDCGIVCQSISLAATSLGLGSCICAMLGFTMKTPKADELAKRIGIPEGFTFGCSVLIGHPAAPGSQKREIDQTKISYVG